MEMWVNLSKQRTVYYHLKEACDYPAKREAPLQATQDKRCHIQKRGKVLPSRRSIEERLQEINNREHMGDWEIDCIESGRSGKGVFSS